MLEVKLNVELRNHVSRDGRAFRELASAKISTSLFVKGILIQPVTYGGCLIRYRVVLVGAASNGSLSWANLFDEYDLIRREDPAIKGSERKARIL